MNRLQKFVEQSANGYRSKRAAYAFDPGRLPPPGENLEWKAVPSFNAADEIMHDASLKDVFILAVGEGCAVVEEPTHDPGVSQAWDTFRDQPR